MGVWRSIFGWKALFRWDALGAIVPGIFVAVGVGVMSVDWFPYHLLIAQIFFAIGALLCVIKFIGIGIMRFCQATARCGLRVEGSIYDTFQYTANRCQLWFSGLRITSRSCPVVRNASVSPEIGLIQASGIGAVRFESRYL